MNILFVVPSYKPAFIYGGTIVAIARLAEILVEQGHRVTVYTTTANGKEELNVPCNVPVVVDGVEVYYFSRITKDHTHISLSLYKHLFKTIEQFDAVHIHSWWNLLVIGAASICKYKGVKYIVSPHGMLSKYIMETNNSLLKRAVHFFIGRKLLKASYLHVSTEMELAESRLVIPKWKASIITNPVTMPVKDYLRKENTVFTIGFLSRIDPKKGLDVLIKALANFTVPFKLLIAGSGEDTYVESLKQLTIDCAIEQKVEWVGWKNGEAKFDFLTSLDLFALTSHSENFAIVVVESLSVGTPVLLSNNVGLYKYVEENDFGWVTGMDIRSITESIQRSYIEKDKRNQINVAGKMKIASEYNDAYIANKYIEMYKGIMKY
jgi:glycosyltransferase involved in cell wall biosynthesis